MNRRWKIEIILKSGEHIYGYYDGIEENSSDVAHKLLTGTQNAIIGICSNDGGNLLYYVSEVAACMITLVGCDI